MHAIAAERGEWYWGYSVESLTGDKEWTAEMFERDWMKFGIGSNDQQCLAEIKEELLSWGTLEVTHSAPTNMEISVKGITKESGVREVCQTLGFSMSDVIAMGIVIMTRSSCRRQVSVWRWLTVKSISNP